MESKENLEEKYTAFIHLEKIVALILFLTFLYELFVFFEMGDSDNIGFGWMLIFGGWALYPLFVPLIILLSIFYIRTVNRRLDYYKISLDISAKVTNGPLLLNLSHFFFYGVAVLLLAFFFKRNVVLICLVMLVIDIFIQNYTYTKIYQFILKKELSEKESFLDK